MKVELRYVLSFVKFFLNFVLIGVSLGDINEFLVRDIGMELWMCKMINLVKLEKYFVS